MKNNSCGPDVGDMLLISKYHKGIGPVIDILSKYECYVALKGKKDITITYTFPKSLGKSSRVQNWKNYKDKRW